MEISELEYLYRHQADDKVPDYRLDSTGFLFFLNEAQRKAVRNGNLLFDKTSAFTRIAVTANKSKYTIDSSIYAITDAVLTYGDGTVTNLEITDRTELNRTFNQWRQEINAPFFLIHTKKSIEIVPTPDTAYTLQLEVYRFPLKIESNSDDLEIEEEHHEHLVDWILYRAFSTKDADSVDIQKATTAKDNFLKYFGQEPRAVTRKDQYANKPHRNKAMV